MPTLEEIMRRNKMRSAPKVEATPTSTEKPVPRKGRPPISGERMTKAEYQRRYRAKKKEQQ